jgi:hypothetical protein
MPPTTTTMPPATTVPSTSTTVRPLSDDATVTSLSTSAGALDQSFSNSLLLYTQSVASSVSTVKVRVSTQSSLAVIRVNNTVTASGVDSGDIQLAVGPNDISISVTPENGSTARIFRITITRA